MKQITWAQVEQELCDMPISREALASSEKLYFDALHEVVKRHQSHIDHKCQSTACLAMFIWNSHEMTQILAEAYRRGATQWILS